MAGSFLAGDLAIWNVSFHYTTVANANLLANLVPLIIIPVSYFIYKEKISRNFLYGSIIVLLGVILLVCGKAKITTGNLFGDVLACLISVFYASFLLFVYKLRSHVSAVQVMFYSAFGTVFVLFFVCLFTEGIQYPYSYPLYIQF